MLVKNNKRSAGKQAVNLPPWIARNQRDNELMAQWLNERLDEIQKWLLTILPVSEEILVFHDTFPNKLVRFHFRQG